MAMGGRTDLRLVESVPASARALRKTGGHSRGILVLGVRSDLLALSASRFGGGLKVSFARNALTCRRLAPSMVASTHRPSQVIGQTISHYRSDPKMLARLWSDDLVVTNPLNKVVNSISVLSEEKHCSRHIPI
jgi:hypothetical protein